MDEAKTTGTDAPAAVDPIAARREMKRRLNFLCVRAEGTFDGRQLCTFCGLLSRNLRKHLKTTHAQEIKARPAAAFH